MTPTGQVLDTKVVDTSKTPAIFGLLATGSNDKNTVLYYTDANSNTVEELDANALTFTREEFLERRRAGGIAAAGLAGAGFVAADLAAVTARVQHRGVRCGVGDEAKHRHAFACISEADNAVAAVTHTIDAYREIGVTTDEVRAAVVFYHGTAVLSAFDDEVWKRYVVPSKTLTKRPVLAATFPRRRSFAISPRTVSPPASRTRST